MASRWKPAGLSNTSGGWSEPRSVPAAGPQGIGSNGVKSGGADAEEHHVGPLSAQRAFHEARAALHEKGAATAVLEEQRPGLPFAPGGGVRRRLQRLQRHFAAFAAAEGRGRVAAGDEGDAPGAELGRVAGLHGTQRRFRQAGAAAHVQHGFIAQQQRTGLACHQRRVHRVGVVAVHGDHRGQPAHAQGGQAGIHRVLVRRDGPEHARQHGPREEAVGHDGRLAIVEHQRADAGEAHPQGRRGGAGGSARPA